MPVETPAARPATAEELAFLPVTKLAALLAGGQARFTITVVNTGDVDLTNVTVTDPLVPACSANIGDLAPGAELAAAIAGGTVNTTWK